MSDVQFEDGNNNTFKSRSVLGAPEVPGMANFLLKKGIIKKEGNAKYLLFFIILFCVFLAILVPFLFIPKEPEFDFKKAEQRMLPS